MGWRQAEHEPIGGPRTMALDNVFWGFLVATVLLALSSLLNVVLNDFELPHWLRGRRRWYALVVLILATAGLGMYSGVMEPGAGLEVSDRSVPPGKSVRATGRGYQPREDVHLSVSLIQSGRSRTISLDETTTTDSRGRFELTFGVPMTAVGAERLSAVGDASGHSESTDFSVPALVPSIELSPPTGRGGVEVDVTGEEFFPGETVALRAGRRPVTTVAADEQGTFFSTLRLPGDKQTDSGVEITVTARGRVTGTPFGSATSTYVVTAATPTRKPRPTPTLTPTEPGGGSGTETGSSAPTTTQTVKQQEPPPDPAMPRTYRGTWTGEDTSDASLTTSIRITLTGGEVGTVVGHSDYEAALTYGGTLRLMEVGSNYVIVRETLNSPSTGVTDILLGARSRNTLDYQTSRRSVVLARN
jgi:hypothetical protein